MPRATGRCRAQVVDRFAVAFRGDASVVTWDAVDLDIGLVEVRGTVIRVKGQGLPVKTTKPAAGRRTLACSACPANRAGSKRGTSPVPSAPPTAPVPTTATTVCSPVGVVRHGKPSSRHAASRAWAASAEAVSADTTAASCSTLVVSPALAAERPDRGVLTVNDVPAPILETGELTPVRPS